MNLPMVPTTAGDVNKGMLLGVVRESTEHIQSGLH